MRNAVQNVVGIVGIAMLTGREALITNGDAEDARIHQLESEVAKLRESPIRCRSKPLPINGVSFLLLTELGHAVREYSLGECIRYV